MGTDLRIVGIDPGTTSGVAVLDLDGELEDYTSRRDFPKDRIIRFMVDSGKPLLVATDVSPPPSLVEEVSSNTGSVLVAPEGDLEREYKEELGREFPVSGEDSHVMDALAAAEYARREYDSKLGEITRRVEEAGVEEDLDDVVELVVKGSLSISSAIAEVEKVEVEAAVKAVDAEERDWKSIAQRRRERIELLESKVSNLQEHLEGRDSRGAENGFDEEDIRKRNRLIRELRSELEEKAAELERLRSERKVLQEAVENLGAGWIRVPKEEDLARAESETVFIESYRGEDIGKEVENVLTMEPSDELREEGLNVVDIREVGEKLETGDSYIIHPRELENTQESQRFMEWLETYRES